MAVIVVRTAGGIQDVDPALREGIGKSGHKTIFLCTLCNWWGPAPKGHYPSNGSMSKHDAEVTYQMREEPELFFEVLSHPSQCEHGKLKRWTFGS